MQLCTLMRLPLFLAAVLVASLAHAELYKWVDARGITNYSNQPPADPKSAQKLATVEDRMSVYTPDKALLEAVEASRQQRNNRTVAAKIASLEQQLEDERRARQYAVAAAQADPGPFYTGYPYVPAAVFVPVRTRHLNNHPRAQPIPGAITGNAIGANGLVAGNSARPAVEFLPPSRTLRMPPGGRSFATR